MRKKTTACVKVRYPWGPPGPHGGEQELLYTESLHGCMSLHAGPAVRRRGVREQELLQAGSFALVHCIACRPCSLQMWC